MKKGSKEYIEFRERRNIANRKYDSKPEVKARKKIYKKAYDINNKERISEYGKINRARPKTKERIKQWRKDNKEHIEEYRKTKDYKRKKAIADKKYGQNNRKKIRKKHQEWAENNKEIIKKYNQKYYTSPKGIINYTYYNHKRLATIKERPFGLSGIKIKEIYKRDKVCVYCGSSIKLELDHIVPLKLGGNSLCNNFVISCKKCNTQKSGRDVFKWCKLKKIKVPKIVLELLRRQNKYTHLNHSTRHITS